MLSRRLETEDIPLVVRWLAEPETSRWLRFAPGVQTLSVAALKLMAARDVHVLRIFTDEAGARPIGVVALSDVDRGFGTATLWYVLGEAAFRGRGLASRAVGELLREGFASGLTAVSAWVVEGNTPSIRVLERNGFRRMGRQRMCHSLDGRSCDRILFDLLASEHAALAARAEHEPRTERSAQ